MSTQVQPEPMLASSDRSRTGGAAPADPAPPELVFGPSGGWRFIDVRELWQFRELVFFLAWRDVKVRYKQAALGVAWAVLQPAATMLVFTLFLGRMAGLSSGPWPYPLFVYAGLVPWTLFATALVGAGQSVVDSERLITKVYFPRLAIPMAAVAAAAVDCIMALGLLLALMAWYGIAPGSGLLLVPVVCGVTALAALGAGALLAALNVAYRDFRYVIPFLVQLGLFATPAIYMQPPDPRAAAPATAAAAPAPGHGADAKGPAQVARLARAAMELNPLNALVATFRAALLGGPIPWGRFALASAYAAALCVAGALYFRKVEDRFGDII